MPPASFNDDRSVDRISMISSDDEISVSSRRIYKSRPAVGVIAPSDWPPRPDIFDEVLLRKPMTTERAHDAYMAWFLPDQELGQVWRQWDAKGQRPFPRPPDKDVDLHVLAHNVYEHLMSDPLLPAAVERSAQNLAEQGLDRLYDLSPNMQQTKNAAIQSGNLGYLDLLNLKQLQSQCKKLGLDFSGKAAELRARITAATMDDWSGMLVQSDLSHWGILRERKFDLEPWKKPKATALEMYTVAIQISPYNPTYWVSRAYCHYLMGFFDLAIGDAYRAGVLCDVLEQSSERNRRPGFYARIWEAIEAHLMAVPRDTQGDLKPEVVRMRKANGINAFVPTLQTALHSIISLSLAGLNAWHDYGDHMKILDRRLGMPDRDVRVPQLRTKLGRKASKFHQNQTQSAKEHFFHEKSAGEVPANQPYPFEKQDVNRTSPTFLQKINQSLFGEGSSSNEKRKPLCRVDKSDQSQEIAVFASGKVPKDHVIFIEEPTIRGHLPPRRLFQDFSGKAIDQHRCENCMKEIKVPQHWEKEFTEKKCPCADRWLRHPDSPGRLFCKPSLQSKSDKGCLEIARQVHHFSSCGRDWTWLYDAMRPVATKWEDQEYFSHTNGAHGTLLLLLLRNVFEIALHRRSEEPEEDMRLNPHEIDELLVLDSSSESWRNSWFPFSMAANIRVPFDILETLGVDIFQRSEFDTWVIQLILRKLLVNAVPWDSRRQGDVSDRFAHDQDKKVYAPKAQFKLMLQEKPVTNLDPSLENLYLFPGLSMFNHSCDNSHNADWGYDNVIPNRVVIWATKPIAPGEEIRIRYRSHAIKSRVCAMRLFGGECRCPRCLKDSQLSESPDPGDLASQEDSLDEETSAVNTVQSRDESWRASDLSESASDDLSYSNPSNVIDLTESHLPGQTSDHAVVGDGKVVFYRELTSPIPMSPRLRKRKAKEPDEPCYRAKIITDVNGRRLKAPTDPVDRAKWARQYREELRDMAEGKEVRVQGLKKTVVKNWDSKVPK
ncbi:hypothetical protein PDE_00839 [Penicillium oxalicum 114-2]|uniref:Histone-lysine N-methyltransferase SET5 n=1 Tax=Penicillium oxalicum (strain 114-2 / CGMCC 5302) TaxID=933388 RepID=S8AJG2_PENO1|nr:hypothetical protein PDE_00839 [Penicillium oxalicum 114-2]